MSSEELSSLSRPLSLRSSFLIGEQSATKRLLTRDGAEKSLLDRSCKKSSLKTGSKHQNDSAKNIKMLVPKYPSRVQKTRALKIST